MSIACGMVTGLVIFKLTNYKQKYDELISLQHEQISSINMQLHDLYVKLSRYIKLNSYEEDEESDFLKYTIDILSEINDKIMSMSQKIIDRNNGNDICLDDNLLNEFIEKYNKMKDNDFDGMEKIFYCIDLFELCNKIMQDIIRLNEEINREFWDNKNSI